MSKLILASSSHYRRALLGNCGFEFDYFAPDIDETPLVGETPKSLVQRLANKKAETVAKDHHSDDFVLGMDQVLAYDNNVYGKPKDRDDALNTLMSLRQQTAYLTCAVALTHKGKTQTRLSICVLEFGTYDQSEVERYLDLEKPYDCAAGLKTETRGALLLNKIISEDPNSIIGIPILVIHQLLRDAGFSPMPLD